MTSAARNSPEGCGVTGLASAVTAAGVAETEAQTGPRVLGPGDVPVSLMVNGKRLELKIEPRVTLLDAVRNRADLTGNKRVCDRGSCGACTMIVDGRTVYSCSTLAIEVQGKQIRTVDGLANGATLHPVQQAFCDVDVDVHFCTGIRRRDRGAVGINATPTRCARPRRQHLPLRDVRPNLEAADWRGEGVARGDQRGGREASGAPRPRRRRSTPGPRSQCCSARRSSGSTARTR